MGIWRRLITSGGQVDPFIFKITTTSSNQVFELPVTAPNGNQPNFVVNWGDGNEDTITSTTDLALTHTYSTANTYTISVEGFCEGFQVNNNASYRGLYVEVVDWGNIGLKRIDFYGCNNLTTLPTDGSGNATNNVGLSTIERFDNTFYGTGITSIPVGLFDYAVNAISFTNTFTFVLGLSGNAIPSGLFDNNTNVRLFSGTFNACLNLTQIPTGLFDNNTLVQNFSSVFRNCRSLTSIPSHLFTNNQNVTTFSNSFNMATTSNALTGTTPADANGDEIWERTPLPLGTDCFAFCTGLSNFASIPVSFK